MKTIKILMRSLREYKKYAILTMLSMILEVAMEVLIPFLLSYFGNCLMPKNGADPDVNGMILYGSLMVVAAIISLFAGMMGGKLGAKASTGFAKNLRKDMFENIQKFSFSNIDKFSSSSLVTRLTTDITHVQMSFMMIIRTAIRSPLMFVFSVIMAFMTNATLPFIFCVTIPILLFSLIFIARKAMPIFKKLFKRYDNFNNSIQENIKGMRVVKAYVREDYETEKTTRVSGELCRDFTRAERILAFNGPIMQFCLQGALIALATVGSAMIIGLFGDGISLTVFDIQSLLTYSMQILMSLMMLSMIFVMITMSAEAARRIVEVLEEKSDLTNPENPVMEVKDGEIIFENVNFRYSQTAERFALEDIDLHIKSGETVGILGGTGSSKTTLVNLISRLYDVSEGSVKVGGVDVRDYDMEVLRNQVAVVLQKNNLFSGTIKDNLRWGNENATDEQMIEACKLAQAHDFITSFPDGYDSKIEQGGANVSGGQKQRLCIARALLKNPKILILDDSTSAVDMKTDALLRQGFKKFIPSTTKIIIAQRVASIMDADKIVIMDNGKIVAVGNHEQLLATNAIYQEVYYSQNRVYDEDDDQVKSKTEGGNVNG